MKPVRSIMINSLSGFIVRIRQRSFSENHSFHRRQDAMQEIIEEVNKINEENGKELKKLHDRAKDYLDRYNKIDIGYRDLIKQLGG